MSSTVVPTPSDLQTLLERLFRHLVVDLLDTETPGPSRDRCPH